MRNVIFGVVFMLLAGCAGTPFKFENARRVQVGMTEAQVVAIMGRPYMVTSRGEEQMWIWTHATAFGGAKSVSMILKGAKVIAIPTIPQSF